MARLVTNADVAGMRGRIDIQVHDDGNVSLAWLSQVLRDHEALLDLIEVWLPIMERAATECSDANEDMERWRGACSGS